MPSMVPLSDLFWNACRILRKNVAAIDVCRNELLDGIAGQPAAFAIATLECMQAIAHTQPEAV